RARARHWGEVWVDLRWFAVFLKRFFKDILCTLLEGQCSFGALLVFQGSGSPLRLGFGYCMVSVGGIHDNGSCGPKNCRLEWIVVYPESVPRHHYPRDLDSTSGSSHSPACVFCCVHLKKCRKSQEVGCNNPSLLTTSHPVPFYSLCCPTSVALPHPAAGSGFRPCASHVLYDFGTPPTPTP
ncbi:unnamed protein product, partial [Discosporangium mesarthrocarpum]